MWGTRPFGAVQQHRCCNSSTVKCVAETLAADREPVQWKSDERYSVSGFFCLPYQNIHTVFERLVTMKDYLFSVIPYLLLGAGFGFLYTRAAPRYVLRSVPLASLPGAHDVCKYLRSQPDLLKQDSAFENYTPLPYVPISFMKAPQAFVIELRTAELFQMITEDLCFLLSAFVVS